MNKYIEPDFLANLIKSKSMDRGLLRTLAKEIPNIIIFEAYANREIDIDSAVEIMTLQNESHYWPIRLLKKLF